MNSSNNAAAQTSNRLEPLTARLQQILQGENLDAQRAMISDVAAELGVDDLECAAALLYLNQFGNHTVQALPEQQKSASPPSESSPASIKMVRYRLEVGRKHQVTLEALVKLLVDESGVDKNNINNVSIHNLHTILELPDGMPPDIFLHLKSVEINQQKLHIKRLKAHPHKKRGNHNFRRGRTNNPQPGQELTAS